MQSSFVFISESVTEGHPDKLCDQISDAIVGRALRQDRLARVVAEAAVSTSIVFLSVKTRGRIGIDVAETARDVIRRVGYEGGTFDARNCTVMTSVDELGPSVRAAVDEHALGEGDLDPLGAEDPTTTVGFACTHTPAFMPMPIWLAHKLARCLSVARRSGDLEWLTPDGKALVGVEFRERRPARIHSVTLVASQRRAERPSLDRLRDELRERVVIPAFADEELRPDASTVVSINPEGPFVKSGPGHHAGLTGRKNVVDTYGLFARHSGSALSGKDPSRIDRVGAYAARHAAKNVVAAGLAEQCEVALSYALGAARPVSIQVETFGTSRVPEDEIARRIERAIDLRVAGIVRRFELRDLPKRDEDGFYVKLASFGHVGRPDLELPWERLDAVDALSS